MWVLGGWVECVNNKRPPRDVVITTAIIMGKLKCRRTKGTRIILASTRGIGTWWIADVYVGHHTLANMYVKCKSLKDAKGKYFTISHLKMWLVGLP
jgi:hypothetical protein